MRSVTITPRYRYVTKRGLGIGRVGFDLKDATTGEQLHGSKQKKECRLWAKRRGWKIASNFMDPIHDNAPDLGDPDIEELARTEIVEKEGDEPKPGVTFVVGAIEVALTSDQLRALATWADGD